jgi:hypothetical protein
MNKELEKSMQDVVDSQPQVSEGVINEKDSDEDSVDFNSSVDFYGRKFDRSIHLVDDEGNPQLTKKGKLRVKKGKSPSKIATGKVSSQQPESYRQCAEVVCGTIFGLSEMVAGDDAKPSAQQANFMITSYEKYFETRQIEDIPPGLAVFLSTTAYLVPVIIITVKKKESNLNKGIKWIKNKFKKKLPKDPELKD